MLAVANQPLRNRLVLGALTGAVHYFLALRWLIDFHGGGYIAVAVLQTLLLVPVAAVSVSDPSFRQRFAGWWLLPSAALVLLEVVQHRFPFGGFPLPALGLSLSESPFLAVAPVGGALMVTALAAVSGAAIAAVILGTRSQKLRVLPALFIIAAVVSCAPAIANQDVEEVLDVAVVQGGGPRGLRATNTEPGDATRRHLEAAEGIVNAPDVVLFPENVGNVAGSVHKTPIGTAFSQLAKTLDANVIVGITESDDEHFRNASIMWDSDGEQAGRYEKHHRVLFGEYLPLRTLVEKISEDARFIPRDAIPGHGPAVLDLLGAPRLGIVISYEVFFADRVAAAVRDGGQLILAPTNAASFVTEEVPAIEVTASRMRAAEFHRTVLQAAPTGYSAIIRPDGQPTHLSGLGTWEVLEGEVPLHTGLTPYARVGDLPMILLAILTLVLPVLLLRRNSYA